MTIGLFFPPADLTWFLPPRSIKSRKSILTFTARLDVFDGVNIRIPLLPVIILYTHRLRGLPKGSFVGNGKGHVKVVDIDGMSLIDGHQHRRNSYIDNVIDERIWAVGIKEV